MPELPDQFDNSQPEAVDSNALFGTWSPIPEAQFREGDTALITDGKVMATAQVGWLMDDGSPYWTGYGLGGYEWEFDFASYGKHGPTHWMPLPPLPNQSDSNP